MRRAGAALLVASSLGIALALFAALPGEGATFELGGQRISLAYPRALALLGLTPLILGIASRTFTDLGRLSLWLSAAARVVAFSSVAIALTLPSRVEPRFDLAVAVAVDVSDSIGEEGLRAATDLTERLRAAALEHAAEITFTAFAGRARRLAPAEDGKVSPARLEEGAESDLAAALVHAASLLPSDRARRILLISDGVETTGDAAATAARLRELGVEVHTSPAAGEVPSEVALLGLELPPKIEAGRPFIVKARVHATRPTEATVRLRQGAVPNAVMPLAQVELEAGENVVELRSVAHARGPVTYRALVELGEPDRFPGNQEVEVTALVEGRPQVLIVAEARARTAPLTAALAASGHGVETVTPSSLPTAASAYERFVGVILVNLPASSVSDARQAALLEATRAQGLTLLVAGGDRSYGLGGWGGTRLAEALPVRLEAEKRRDRPSLALVLVIDKSGSMSGAKMELAKEAAKATAELLAADDYLGVIGFDSAPQRVVRMQTARNRLGIRRDISRITPSGGTAIFPALDMAYRDLAVTRAKIKHVILLTDGQAPEAGIPELTRVMRAEGITVSTIGLGSDVQRGLLESVAALGGGRSHFTNDPSHIPRIFMRETTTVSRSAVVEELVSLVPTKRAGFMRGLALDRAPYLRGYVATRMKASPSELLVATELGDPLLARRRLGEGHVVAWTSDLEPKWAVDLLRWPKFAAFLAQLLREHHRDEEMARLPLAVTRRGDTLRVTVDALDPNDHLLRGLESTTRLFDASGEKIAEALAKETAPGIYEASFALDRFGAFRIEAEHRRGDERVAVGDARVSHPYPDEWSRLGTDEARLSDIARAGGGSMLSSPRELFAEPPARDSRAPIQDGFILVALVSFLFDLLLRRTRIFER